MKTIIYNVKIADGTGTPVFPGDVLVCDDKISQIIPNNNQTTWNGKVDRAIDGHQKVLSPGFIDTHSHSDLKVLSDPHLLPKLHQGITTEVLGQDGVSMAPLPKQFISPWKKNLAGLDGADDKLDWSYQTVDHYLNLIQASHPSLNEAYLLPHGNVRMEAMGLDNRSAETHDIEKMCDIVASGMQDGCFGLSSGLIYMPCAYGKTEELIEMCKVVNQYGGVFVVHQRSEADAILDSMDEIIRIGRESGVPIHFSHFKVCGKKNWKYLDGMINKLEEAEAEGIDITFDQYPYVAGSTMLSVILPPWAHDGGTEKLLQRLQDSDLRQKMKVDIHDGIPGWDNFIDFAGTGGIYITSTVSEKNQDVVGLSLDELGEKWNEDPLDAAFDLLVGERNAVGMVDFYGTEDHIKRLIQRPEMNLCTDGLLSGTPHPRVYGAFPRFLGKYVRKEKILSLEDAVRKITGKAADSLKIPKRGYIREGYKADLVLFDPNTIIDKSTYTNPRQYPSGIDMVMVNGVIALFEGKEENAFHGEVLRK